MNTTVALTVASIPDDWSPDMSRADWCPRKTALAGFGRADALRRSLAADRMLHMACTRRFGRKHRYRDDGRPVCVSGSAYVSASHDGDCVMVGTAGHPVGVDLVDGRRPCRELETILNAQELDEYMRHERSRQFLCDAWALRESTLKCKGTGLRDDFRSLHIQRTQRSDKTVRVSGRSCRYAPACMRDWIVTDGNDSFFAMTFHYSSSFSAAVCCTLPFDIELERSFID